MDDDRTPEQQRMKASSDGMVAMMAMMAICCVGVFVLVLLIPLVGWPAGVALAVGGGAALMYAHHRFMGHGSRH